MARELTYRGVVLGAGAAGMMCAAHAGPGILVVDHARAPGEKIRISGGGRCNFTNLGTAPDRFLSANPHFAKSALSRYTQWDFIDLVERHGIGWHEKTLGQLFCDRSARDVVALLQREMDAAGATLMLQTRVVDVAHDGAGFRLELESEGARLRVVTPALILASGGLSIPKMGASGLAYGLARRFGLGVTETRAGLVPLTFGGATLERLKTLAGLAAPARISAGGAGFEEALLFTHRGLSGPAILQASSYWREGSAIAIDLDPGAALLDALMAARRSAGRRSVANTLAAHLPARLARALASEGDRTTRLADCPDKALADLVARLRDWRITPSGTEGYRTAEVTLGGIDTADLDSRTMQARPCPGLYAIGEAVDVTGWLGGYNFQWAWSSGWAAGQAIAAARAT